MEKLEGEYLHIIVLDWLDKNRKYLFLLAIRYKLLKDAFYQFSKLKKQNDELMLLNANQQNQLNSTLKFAIKEYTIMLLNEVILVGDLEILHELKTLYNKSLFPVFESLCDGRLILFKIKYL